jgi:hypothetical protein
MKIEKFNKLKSKLETFAFEENFKPLATTLYYFSFLGNVFLILFSFFFIKDVTNTIPLLFEGQNIFFSIFVLLFMVGYELFKRFSFEQLTTSILKTRKFTVNIFLGTAICLALVTGSFYLSLNGAHRLIDNSDKIELVTDNTINKKTDSISLYYNKQISVNQSQISKLYENDTDGLLGKYEKSSLEKFQKTIKELDSIKRAEIKLIESKYQNKNTNKLDELQQNDTAFAFMVFFLEFIILIGVAFDAYYTWTSFENMSRLLKSTKFQEVQEYTKILRVIYENGKNRKDDIVMDYTKLKAICDIHGIPVNENYINKFLETCNNFGILSKTRDEKYSFLVDYNDAKNLLEEQFYL